MYRETAEHVRCQRCGEAGLVREMVVVQREYRCRPCSARDQRPLFRVRLWGPIAFVTLPLAYVVWTLVQLLAHHC